MGPPAGGAGEAGGVPGRRGERAVGAGILLTLLGIIAIVGAGVLWGIRPPAPDWWPVRESWWLLGGWATGATMIFSGLVALALMFYSWRRFTR